MKKAYNADELLLPANTHAQAESLLHRLEQAAKGIDHYVDSLNDKPLKLENKFTCLSSNISSTESDVNITHRKMRDCYWPIFDHMEI